MSSTRTRKTVSIVAGSAFAAATLGGVLAFAAQATNAPEVSTSQTVATV